MSFKLTIVTNQVHESLHGVTIIESIPVVFQLSNETLEVVISPQIFSKFFEFRRNHESNLLHFTFLHDHLVHLLFIPAKLIDLKWLLMTTAQHENFFVVCEEDFVR